MSESAENLIKIVNQLQDKLNPLGINNLVSDLPQIAVVGGQSAGKSSVLESFVGKEFLPRGNNIVTRRPLILHLVHKKKIAQPHGEFLHLPGKQFKDFNEIRDEITNETDREVKDSAGISPNPITLTIYSADVLDLTLVDLPGMTRVPVGSQPKDIEQRIKDMILSFIRKKNCLILAVTGANQDLATSDALNLAAEVDPDGERTIGVLTKLDRMEEGMDARDILTGRHDIKLKRGFIGIINRSQRDIDSNKSMADAVADERKYFNSHPAYKDIADRIGISFLQKYLNKELSKHIFNLLPPLKQKFESELFEINEKLVKISSPFDDSDKERILSESNEELRQRFESAVGGKSWKIDVAKLSGGAKINLIMNDTFAKEINKLFYDENRLRREIATSIQNFFGVFLGVFTPDAAFRAVVEHQIDLFRSPSLVCVDEVTNEIELIIKDIMTSMDSYSTIKQLFAKFTLEYVRECKKKCKYYIEHFVEGEKAYLNTLHDDFIKTIGENSPPIAEAQLKVTAQVVKNNIKHDWIYYNKKKYWFVLTNNTLCWYKEDTQKTERGSLSVRGAQFKTFSKDDTLVLRFSEKLKVLDSSNEMRLTFPSSDTTDKWKEWLEEAGVRPNNGDDQSVFENDSDTNSLSNVSVYNHTKAGNSSQEDMAYPEHMKVPVEQVKRLVDSYVAILKKKFKDTIPRLCVLEMVDSMAKFIAIELKLKIRKEITSINDIVGEDPDEELRRDLSHRQIHYCEAIDIITKYSTKR